MQGGRCTYRSLSFVFLLSELSGMAQVPRLNGRNIAKAAHAAGSFLVSCMPP